VRTLDFSRYASACVAAALLAGCGESQPTIGAPAGPQATTMFGAVARNVLSAPEIPNKRAARYDSTQPLLYVTNVTFAYNDVRVYHARARDPAPLATISDDIETPSGDCIDGSGTLYVANEPSSGSGWISEYPLGKVIPSKVITDGISTPAFCAIDDTGNLWVTNIGGPSVTEYLSGSKRVHTKITKGLVFPVGIAIDHSGNLYVSNRLASYSGNVVVYPPGSKSPSRTITDGVTSPVGIALDSKATLYVTDDRDSNVKEYLSGHDHPYRTITQGMNAPVGVTVNTKGWLYVANFGDNTVAEFPPGSTTPSKREITNAPRVKIDWYR
jgi:hypothetical protein